MLHRLQKFVTNWHKQESINPLALRPFNFPPARPFNSAPRALPEGRGTVEDGGGGIQEPSPPLRGPPLRRRGIIGAICVPFFMKEGVAVQRQRNRRGNCDYFLW